MWHQNSDNDHSDQFVSDWDQGYILSSQGLIQLNWPPVHKNSQKVEARTAHEPHVGSLWSEQVPLWSAFLRVSMEVINTKSPKSLSVLHRMSVAPTGTPNIQVKSKNTKSMLKNWRRKKRLCKRRWRKIRLDWKLNQWVRSVTTISCSHVQMPRAPSCSNTLKSWESNETYWKTSLAKTAQWLNRVCFFFF